jgi:hypothetical protein
MDAEGDLLHVGIVAAFVGVEAALRYQSVADVVDVKSLNIGSGKERFGGLDDLGPVGQDGQGNVLSSVCARCSCNRNARMTTLRLYDTSNPLSSSCEAFPQLIPLVNNGLS